MRGFGRCSILVGLLWGLCGCDSLWAGLSQTNPNYCPPDMGPECSESIIDTAIQTAPTNQVDVLFVIQNSGVMKGLQFALAENIPKFIDAFSAIQNIEYHFGFATSDVGSTTAPNTSWAGCSYLGDDGMLQATPCTQRAFADPNALAACNMLCPAGNEVYVPTDNTNFIYTLNGQTNVLPADPMVTPSQAVQNAFQCMALVGDQGCEIQSPLESAKRALDGRNAGFLRSDSLLMIIFITNADDCSVQLSNRAENNPITTDCPTPDPNANWSCFNPQYRCMAMDVQCDQPMNEPGQKTNCTERADTYLTAVTQYQSFFSGLRSPGNIVIAGLWTTPSIEMGGVFNVVQNDMPADSEGLLFDTGTDAGCTYTGTDPNSMGVYGWPQLRLSKFLSAFPNSPPVLSVCDTDQYAPYFMNTVTNAIKLGLNRPCLGGMPKLNAQGQPECIVGDVDAATPHASPGVPFPVCQPACCAAWAAWDPTKEVMEPVATDMAPRMDGGVTLIPTTNRNPQLDAGIMMACASDTSPCYCAVASETGVCSAGNAVAGVWRAGTAIPPNMVTNFNCAVQ